MQQLVDQGATINIAREVVSRSYPTTHGDTFYRSDKVDKKLGHAVGVYGLWNGLRGDQSPLGGTKVSDDARTIAQFWRLSPTNLDDIIEFGGQFDTAISHVAIETANAMRRGDYFEPVAVEPDNDVDGRVADLRAEMAKLDGIGDYIRSIPLPNFNG